MRIAEITSFDQAPTDAEPTKIRPRKTSTSSMSRRAVVKALAVGAVAATLVPLDWALARREAAAAGPTSSWNHPRCGDYMSYTTEANNWPSSGYRACYGGSLRGTFPCNSNKFHFEGWKQQGSTSKHYSYRVATCKGKNAWRWTTQGNVYRCSDARTQSCYWEPHYGWSCNNTYRLTIARCYLWKA
ncbi:hypothetical protein [Phytoactinopolyspora limicola]|uniref:hypothetical protein n=1 Tax=Phytoactinopolyspora limicola TaxID=2715536 RepID=UPI00140E77F4|nr:hypothetical protein [Phytoactinopolyspora limicola]